MSLIPERTDTLRHALSAIGLDRELPTIRRNLDGTIDYDWYTRRARTARAQAIGRLLGRIAKAIARAARRGVIDPLREWRARDRAIAELAQMDDRMLRDMGLDRGGVIYAVEHGRDSDLPPANDNAPKRKISTAA